MSALNVGTKGAQKFGLMQLKAMKSPDSAQDSLNNRGVSTSPPQHLWVLQVQVLAVAIPISHPSSRCHREIRVLSKLLLLLSPFLKRKPQKMLNCACALAARMHGQIVLQKNGKVSKYCVL